MADVFEERLNRMEADFETANVRVGEATWSVYSGEGEADLDAAHSQLAQVLSNRSDHSLVESWLANVDPGKEPLLARRLAVWQNCFKSSDVDNAPEIYKLKNRLQRRIATFHFELEGKPILRSELQRILRLERDRELRHRAWRASAALASANRDDLRHLIKLRNLKARELAYRDYVDLIFKVQEIDEEWLHQTLQHLATAAQPVYSAVIESLRGMLGVEQLAPWDMQYALRQGFQLPDSHFPADKALDHLRTSARALGFAVDSLSIRTVIRDIPFGGYTVAVKIPEDVRFLVNPSEGQRFYTTTFHEYGHSLQAALTATNWPILKEYEWALGAHAPAYSEGMAEVFGEFPRRADWLLTIARVPEKEVERYRTQLSPAQMVTRLFDLLLNMRMELSAYADTSQDLSARERELTREVRLLEFPAEDPPQWEANTWYAAYPVYWQNYILASVVASQIQEAITESFGENASSNDRVGEYLRNNFYAYGNTLPWMERVKRGTGRPLSTEAYLRRLRITG